MASATPTDTATIRLMEVTTATTTDTDVTAMAAMATLGVPTVMGMNRTEAIHTDTETVTAATVHTDPASPIVPIIPTVRVAITDMAVDRTDNVVGPRSRGLPAKKACRDHGNSIVL